MMTDTRKPHLILTGFMGVGKSTIGPLVAKIMGRSFVDMDQCIEDETGLSISDIFAQKGELFFRHAEAQLVRTLCEKSGLVIATGGGTFLDAKSRAHLMSSGLVVNLNAGRETLVKRLEGVSGRPLLPSSEQINGMLLARKNAYDSAPVQIFTENLSVKNVVELVVEAAENEGRIGSRGACLPVVSSAAGYPLRVEAGGLFRMGLYLNQRGVSPGRVVVVSDEHVMSLHGATLLSGLNTKGYEPFVLTISRGEAAKNLNEVSRLYASLAAAHLERHRPILAFGGGSIGDVAGFLASTWMRGVPFFQIPTTLLSMVDSSVGGKTGVDLPAGKNLVGAFKHPEMVLQDPDVLETLSDRAFSWGLAESVKHAIISSPTLFRLLESLPTPRFFTSEVLKGSLQVKIDIVSEDPWEDGIRETLNLGHTFAHAIEKVSDYKISHGEAVSVGLIASAELSVSLAQCQADLPRRIRSLLQKLGLPITAPGLSVDAVLEAMKSDKKRRQNRLRFVIPQKIGRVGMVNAPSQALLKSVLYPLLQRQQLEIQE